jgi:hypothetical protein
VEEESEAGRLLVPRGDHDLGHLPPFEERGAERGFIGNHLVRELLIVRELSDEVEDQPGVVGGCEAKGYGLTAEVFGVVHGAIINPIC